MRKNIIMSTKTINKGNIKKIANWIISVISIIIACFALVLIISTITSSKKGYTSIFNYAYFTVESESMNKGEEGFAKGDIIYVKLLNDEEKAQLKKGDVITFWDIIDGQKKLNTHRIEQVMTQDNGAIKFLTKGDANEYSDIRLRDFDDVQGIYKGKAEGFGSAIMWMQSKTGFLVCVIIPSILIVLYCLYLVIYNVIQYNKQKIVLAKEEIKEEMDGELRQKLKEELLKEIEQQKAKEQEPSKE
ncbi:signal peptidase I [bacterium]|nr:signal peptidase I [bacterium]